MFGGMSLISLEFNPREYFFVMQRMREIAQEKALKAEKYNQKNQLTSLPNDALKQILSYGHVNGINPIQALKNSIKNLIQLKSTCKRFNNLLTAETIGNFCKDYDLAAKNKLLSNLDLILFYEKKRQSVLILICAGADPNITIGYNQLILFQALWNKDIPLIDTLFKHHANPNQHFRSQPIFFHADTLEIAQKFIDQGANIHAVDDNNANVLWEAVGQGYSLELLTFYLDKKVDAKNISHHHSEACVLHSIANLDTPSTINVDVLLKKATLLLDTIPHMINTLNSHNETPLDLAQKNYIYPTTLAQLTYLFKKRGGLTSEELKQQQEAKKMVDKGPEELLLSIQKCRNMSHIDQSLLMKKNKDGENVLHLACKQDDMSSVLKICTVKNIQELLFQPDQYGNLCIHAAARNGHYMVIDALIKIQRHAKHNPWHLISHKNNTDFTPLHLAAMYGHVKAAQSLITWSGDKALQLIFQAQANGNTPLHSAAEFHKAEMVKFLLAASSNSARKLACVYNYDGLTAIHLAIKYNHIEAIKAFLQVAIDKYELGIVLNLKDTLGLTPLEYAQKYNRSKIIELLETPFIAIELNDKNPKDLYTLIKKAFTYHMNEEPVIKTLQMHIAQGHVTHKILGEISLIACAKGDIDCIRIILAASENQAAKIIQFSHDRFKETPLHIACSHGDTKIAKILIDAADQDAPTYVCMQDLNGNTAFMEAVSNGHKDIIPLIIQAAGEQIWTLLGTRNVWGKTALMQASLHGHTSTLEDLIVAAGTHALDYLNMQSNAGHTAIDGARLHQHTEALTFLKKTRKALIEATKIKCTLCLDKKIPDEFYSMNGCNSVDTTITGCAYSFCTECLLEHISTHLDEGSTHGLTCPNIQCGKKMHQSDIQIITQNNKELYERFDKITFEEFIMHNNNKIKKCPTPNCECTYEVDDEIRHMKCPSCKNIYCSHCRVKHAQEMTCEQAREHAQLVGNADKEKAANQEWLQQHTKACPHCNTLIEKNGGCYYMFCKKCSHKFCWKCLQPHDHTMNHPCGLWEDEEDMNQAEQDLIQNGQ